MKRHDEVKEKRKKLAMSIFVVAIMTLSVLGYIVVQNTGQSTTTYKDFKFLNVNNQWYTKIGGKNILFDYHPAQVEYINVSKTIIDRINSSVQLYQTSDVNSSDKQAIALAQFDIVQDLSLRNQYAVNGFTTENEFNLPVITCANSTQYVPVLMYQRSNETDIYDKDNCIILEARSDSDFIALKDRILYGVFGIIS
jgi:hypothetical protein